MKRTSPLVFLISALSVILLMGCAQQNPPADSVSDEAASEEVTGTEPASEESTHESAAEPEIPPVTQTVEDPEQFTEDIAMNFAEKLGYDTSELYIIEQNELFKSDEFWFWMLTLEGENGPVATTYIRADLGMIESFDCIHDFAPRAVPPGGEYPSLTAEALGLVDRGYSPAPWVSDTGNTIYRKHVPISGHDVTVSNVLIRFVPDDGKLIGVNWNQLEPIERFEMNIDSEQAVDKAAEYLEEETIAPDNLDLIQIQDGPSRFTDLNVYWEVTSDHRYVYVRCNDGHISVNLAGINVPLGI